VGCDVVFGSLFGAFSLLCVCLILKDVLLIIFGCFKKKIIFVIYHT
jgi:hypothetical protein